MTREHAGRVERLAALRRARAWLDAQEQRLLHLLATDPVPELGPEALEKQWVREDVACALLLSPAVARDRLADAVELVERLPRTLAALESGDITLRHASRLVDAVAPLPDETAAAVEARVLPRAASQTPAQFAASVRRAVLALDPRDQEQQVEDAEADRRVCFTPREDGTTELWSLLPADVAAAIRTAIDDRADQLNGLDERTADQRRADALAELILGTTTPQVRVNVTVSLSTLLDLDSEPGELDGAGPIPAALARALAFDPTGTWRRLLTDERGDIVDAGRSRYRPPPHSPGWSPPNTPPALSPAANARPAAARSTTYSPGSTAEPRMPTTCTRPLPPASPLETRNRLASRATPRRHHPLAITHRPHLRPTTRPATPGHHQPTRQRPRAPGCLAADGRDGGLGLGDADGSRTSIGRAL